MNELLMFCSKLGVNKPRKRRVHYIAVIVHCGEIKHSVFIHKYRLGSVHYLWPEGGAKISQPIVVGEGGQLFFSILFWIGDFFLTHYFANFFFSRK